VNVAQAERFAAPCPDGGGAGACQSCREMCSRGYPGRFTPDEASRAIDAGLASRMMLLRYGKTTMLRPAIIGWEGLSMDEGNLARGQCVFLGAAGGCELHAAGPKPLECRVASCSSMRDATVRRADGAYHGAVDAIERAWRGRAGRAVVDRWLREQTS